MAQSLSQIERTAYHEAGHTVMSFLLCKRFRKVSIISDGDSSGRLLGVEGSAKKLFDQLENELTLTLRIRKKVEDEIMILYSGDIAVEEVQGVESTEYSQ